MSSCQLETKKYRQCLKDSHSRGCDNKACDRLAQTLEECRAEYRRTHDIAKIEFDGRRILPNKKCQPLNRQVQKCMKWKDNDQSKCAVQIEALRDCMSHQQGILAPPTEGDKIWSDYNNTKQEEKS